MKKSFILAALCAALMLSLFSCRNTSSTGDGKDIDPDGNVGEKPSFGERIDELLNIEPTPIKTVEYSVMYLDKNSGLTSYDTGSLEQSEPLTAEFILKKVIDLSELSVSANGVKQDGKTVYVDFSSDFFLSDENTEKNESSLLFSTNRSLLSNLDGVTEVCFSLDGEDFITEYHAYSATRPFDPKSLDEQKAQVTSIPYTVEYYDVFEDSLISYSDVYRYVDEMNPQYFVKRLSELTSVSIAVNSVTLSEDTLTIDFSSDGAPESGLGSYEESRLLDSLCSLFMQVYPTAQRVCISMDGGTYNSGHIISESTTPYATNKQKQLG